MSLETPQRIEPALFEDFPASISNLAAELSSAAEKLTNALAPQTAAGLADMVRIMNSYYSNLIEGHHTRPRDIERALNGRDVGRPEMAGSIDRDLLSEAVAHVRVQREIDRRQLTNTLLEPASADAIKWLHREFYKDAPESLRLIVSTRGRTLMRPGEWRTSSGQDVVVGRHHPPSSERVEDFMRYFEARFRFAPLGKAQRIAALAAAHHRFNFIHPFPDGNGRVSRLMSHAMAQAAGIGAHGLWSVSRGLARGLESRTDYKRWMDHADTPRQGDLDGRGNLSLKALVDFTIWFLRVCLDQIRFMSDLFDFANLSRRMKALVETTTGLRPETASLLEEALIRGEVPRGDASRVTGLPSRSAQRVVAKAVESGLLGSKTPKSPLYLLFPMSAQETLFPKLYLES